MIPILFNKMHEIRKGFRTLKMLSYIGLRMKLAVLLDNWAEFLLRRGWRTGDGVMVIESNGCF